MLEKRDWLRKRWDRIRRALLTEPRGHVDLCGAVLTEAVTPGSHAGVLFMDTGGFSAMSGHGVIAVVTIALERGLLHLSDPSAEVVLDTPAGTIAAKATWNDKRVERVSFLNVPSFVLHPGVSLKIGARTIQADIAFGGMFYVIADSETLGVAVQPGALAELRTLGSELRRAAELAVKPVHPKERTPLCVESMAPSSPDSPMGMTPTCARSRSWPVDRLTDPRVAPRPRLSWPSSTPWVCWTMGIVL